MLLLLFIYCFFLNVSLMTLFSFLLGKSRKISQFDTLFSLLPFLIFFVSSSAISYFFKPDITFVAGATVISWFFALFSFGLSSLVFYLDNDVERKAIKIIAFSSFVQSSTIYLASFVGN